MENIKEKEKLVADSRKGFLEYECVWCDYSFFWTPPGVLCCPVCNKLISSYAIEEFKDEYGVMKKHKRRSWRKGEFLRGTTVYKR
jgi:hypothetical protein